MQPPAPEPGRSLRACLNKALACKRCPSLSFWALAVALPYLASSPLLYMSAPACPSLGVQLCVSPSHGTLVNKVQAPFSSHAFLVC